MLDFKKVLHAHQPCSGKRGASRLHQRPIDCRVPAGRQGIHSLCSGPQPTWPKSWLIFFSLHVSVSSADPNHFH